MPTAKALPATKRNQAVGRDQFLIWVLHWIAAAQIFKVWHKISRVLYLDPDCMERVLRAKYERTVARYFNQMVVEYHYEEDL